MSAPLAAGYNVLTWDPRGFGASGGNVEIDSPDYEARDASALIDFVAKQPEAQLDKPGDPRLGSSAAAAGWHSEPAGIEMLDATRWGNFTRGGGAGRTGVRLPRRS